MAEFRDNYIKAREIIADELKEKYNLVESYREYDRLTLDSTTHSIHFTFYVPDGDEVYISKKGKQPADGESFRDLFYNEYPSFEKGNEELQKLFRSKSSFDYSKLYQNENLEEVKMFTIENSDDIEFFTPEKRYEICPEEYSLKTLYFEFSIKIGYLEKVFPVFFNTIT